MALETPTEANKGQYLFVRFTLRDPRFAGRPRNAKGVAVRITDAAVSIHEGPYMDSVSTIPLKDILYWDVENDFQGDTDG